MHEVVAWGAALLSLIGFGLAIGVNPALYGATADMLARDVDAAPRLRWMVGGLAVGATVLVLIFHSFDPSRIVAASQGALDQAIVNRTIDLLSGAVFLAAAGVVVWWRIRIPNLPTKPRKQPKPNSGAFSYFFLGLGACIGFTTLPIMYLTGRVISGISTNLVVWVLAYVVFLAALAAPFFALAWVWARVPKLTGRITEFYARALVWDYRWPVAVLLVLVGLLFLGLALFAHRGV
ncbi:hypothetical protein MUN76_10540 [Leucobacter rhizosphaerae]|uniref:Sap-like sulfolipid-1-addressing protein n=1 Tax=Leucobacter rhizosphaerae TaxID=2932245 RepID=A0ABY4FTA3_9MICO|nr:hypothetical protein [Leucobacter rhizosphaerae]UOQ59490.1 hypothetical protein MUN76_10540 [Leucobacter rhizosphaerae]